MATYSLLYRGPLSSCNYACGYCPFAKHHSPPEELRADRRGLERFIDWASDQTSTLRILFTPWGEALVRRWYQEGMQRLSHMPHIERVAAQTNLSWALYWLEKANLERLALWVTYHPGETALERFVARCQSLDALGVRYSVGVVGLREHFDAIQHLRQRLDDGVYLWVNAYKSEGPGYYRPGEVEVLRSIDPLFELNNQRHESFGASCRAGAESFTVDGAGDVRRCHFVGDVLGNLYSEPLENMSRERPRPNATCGCYIGYVNLDRLRLYPIYEGGIMERIPASPSLIGGLRRNDRLDCPSLLRTNNPTPQEMP